MIVEGVLWLALSSAQVQVVATQFSVSGVFNLLPETCQLTALRELGAAGIATVSPAQATERLGLERKEELFSCEAPLAACASALGEALGVSGILQGSISHHGAAGYQVALRVISPSGGRPLAIFFEAGVDERNLMSVLARGARGLGAALATQDLERLLESPDVHSTRTSPIVRKIGWTALALALATAAVGVGAAIRRFQLLTATRPTGPVSDNDPDGLAIIYAQAEEARQVAVTHFLVSAGSLLASVVILAEGFHPLPVAPVFELGSGGALLGVRGAF
jgi:hypothetical protein